MSAAETCLRPCRINEYLGKITYFELAEDRTAFTYFYKPPEKKKIEEEYLLYDIFGVIGVVGGSIGLCLGISMRGKYKLPSCKSKEVTLEFKLHRCNSYHSK